MCYELGSHLAGVTECCLAKLRHIACLLYKGLRAAARPQQHHWGPKWFLYSARSVTALTFPCVSSWFQHACCISRPHTYIPGGKKSEGWRGEVFSPGHALPFHFRRNTTPETSACISLARTVCHPHTWLQGTLGNGHIATQHKLAIPKCETKNGIWIANRCFCHICFL